MVDTTENQTSTLTERFASLLSLVDEQSKAHSTFMKTVNSELKALQKESNKLQKVKKSRKKSDEDGDGEKRKNVFDTPVPVSDALCEFLNVEKGQMYSRQFISNSIRDYVKTHELQNPENKRYIDIDKSEHGKKLGALLEPDQPLTFFNMQRYLKPHYPKGNDTDRTDTTRTDTTDSSSEDPSTTASKKTRNKKEVSTPEPTVVVPDDEVVEEGEPVETKKKTRRAVRKG
jgi:chromatin remodeling complex protein RSC6